MMLIPIRANIFAQCGSAKQADIDAGQADALKAGDGSYKKLAAYYQRILAIRSLPPPPPPEEIFATIRQLDNRCTVRRSRLATT